MVRFPSATDVLPATRSKQNEAGVKADFDNYAVTLALFEIGKVNEYGDVVTNTYVQNGLQRNRGAELSLFGMPFGGFRVYSGLALIDTRIERSAQGALDGKSALGVPEYNLTASADWDVPGVPGLAITGGVIRTGSTWTDTENTLRVRAWTRLDAGLRYTAKWAEKPVALRFSVQNLADRNYFMNDRGGANL